VRRIDMATPYDTIQRTFTRSIPLNPIEKTKESHMSKEVVGSQQMPPDPEGSSLVPQQRKLIEWACVKKHDNPPGVIVTN
jgi:hypothetical protein